MWRVVVILLVLAVGAGVLASGGQNDRAVLTAGYVLGNRTQVHRVSDAEAARTVRGIYAAWHAELRSRAAAAPGQRFDNPSRRRFEGELRRLSQRDGFRVVSSTFLQPRQLAPAVVISTRDYVGLAHATAAIEHQLDEKRNTGDDRTGWRWEGFFFEAVDEHGVPFLAVDNLIRGQVAGQQWARSDALFPFAHG